MKHFNKSVASLGFSLLALVISVLSPLAATNTNAAVRPQLNSHQVFYRNWQAADTRVAAQLTALNNRKSKLMSLSMEKEFLAKGSGAGDRAAANSLSPAITALNKQRVVLKIQREEYELKFPGATQWAPRPARN